MTTEPGLYEHFKELTVYRVLHSGLSAANADSDPCNVEIVVYIDKNLQVWTRPAYEFHEPICLVDYCSNFNKLWDSDKCQKSWHEYRPRFKRVE